MSRVGLSVAVFIYKKKKKILTRNAPKAEAKIKGLFVTSFSDLLAVSCFAGYAAYRLC